MLFSEAETEFEMNKLKNQLKREMVQEYYEKVRKEERERIITLLLENGADKRLIELIKNDPYLKEQLE